MFHFGPGTASSICLYLLFSGLSYLATGKESMTRRVRRRHTVKCLFSALEIVSRFQNLRMDYESAREAESQTAPSRREFGVYVSAFRVTCAWTLLRHAQPPEARQGTISVRRRAHSHWRHVQQAPQSSARRRPGMAGTTALGQREWMYVHSAPGLQSLLITSCQAAVC
jgi:hypothetical protein